jgi:capsular exopolysaccharide synthesis family protein
LELQVYIKFVLRWAWLIVLIAGIGAVAGYLVSSQQTPMYAATAKLMVSQNRGVFSSPNRSFDDVRTSERLALTMAELIRSRPIISSAVASLGLENELSVGTVNARTVTDVINGTELFLLTVRDTDASRAVALANAIVAAFQDQERELLDNPFAQDSSLLVIETARAGANPISPQPMRDALLLAVIGGMLAVAIGFLIDLFNNKMRNEREVQEMTALVPLATIGVLKGSTPREKLVTIRDIFAADSETYRMLRTSIDAFDIGRVVRTIAIASGEPREGKSTTAANLAVAMAQTGRTVILVDADLRHPSIHEFFGLPNEAGMSNALINDGQLMSDLLQPTEVENLRVLTGGPISDRPSLLIGSARMPQLVKELCDEADLVIFDTPALLSVVDANLLVRAVDAALLVLRASATSADTAKKAYASLQQAEVNVLGLLLNAAAFNRGQDYYRQVWQRVSQQRASLPSSQPRFSGD